MASFADFDVCTYECTDTNCVLPHPFSPTTSIDEEFICGICQELMLFPSCCVEGHSWCKSCIETWLVTSKTCPSDRSVLTLQTLGRNRIVENVSSF
jgi:hypothetical protein